MDATVTGVLGYVTTAEAARILHVTPNAIIQRIRRYNLPTLRLGKRLVLVKLGDLRLTSERES